MAVTHIAEKLQPLTPQLELLHNMCFHFMSYVSMFVLIVNAIIILHFKNQANITKKNKNKNKK